MARRRASAVVPWAAHQRTASVRSGTDSVSGCAMAKATRFCSMRLASAETASNWAAYWRTVCSSR